MIGTTIGNYVVERQLGEGGMSHVYLGKTIVATDTLPAGFTVVLKVMSDELAGEVTAKKRFIKEGQILSKLRHRYITQFYEFMPREQGAVLVMEFVQGQPLDQKLAQRGAMKISDAIGVCQCLLEALVYAHGKGIVHRDIKPANLICEDAGTIKVTDFGIAKIKEASGSSGATVLTKSGFLLGTPHYMSPEQIREPKDAGAKSDVYSTGVVLYEMLTGVLPFNSRSLPKLIDAVYRGDKPSPRALRPEIDADLEGIVLRAMHQSADQRYESARAFYEALEEYNLRPRRTQPIESGPARAMPAAPAAGASHWQLIGAQNATERHDIKGDSIMIGRDRACSIVLSHPAVSRRHARITLSGAACFVEDLNSANGTYLNNARVEKAKLKPGDIVRFGADPACAFVVKDK